jgi:hypothetical protein
LPPEVVLVEVMVWAPSVVVAVGPEVTITVPVVVVGPLVVGPVVVEVTDVVGDASVAVAVSAGVLAVQLPV